MCLLFRPIKLPIYDDAPILSSLVLVGLLAMATLSLPTLRHSVWDVTYNKECIRWYPLEAKGEEESDVTGIAFPVSHSLPTNPPPFI